MALLAPSADLIGGLFLARTTRSSPFTDDALAALRSLQPHLGRAVQVRLRLEVASSARRQALEALDLVEQAVLLVDANAAVRHANRAAEALLRSGGLKTVAVRSPATTRTTRARCGGSSARHRPARAMPTVARSPCVGAPASARCRCSWRD